MTDGLPDQNETKTCTKCEETKPVTEFYVLRPRKYGGYSYRPSCKQCDSKGAMAWTDKNRDKINARRRERYHNSERVRQASTPTSPRRNRYSIGCPTRSSMATPTPTSRY
jgi:hypothetical protein